METEFDCADRDWLGMDPLKEESADAVGTELGLPFASRGFFLVKDAHLFLTALSVLQANQIYDVLAQSMQGVRYPQLHYAGAWCEGCNVLSSAA